MTTIEPRRRWRSAGALFLGFLAVVLLSLGTDIVMHATGIFPPWFQPMSDGLWLLATAYRVVFGVVGGYIAARLAPHRPMRHALVLGFVGLVISIIGVAATWGRGPEYGPAWYPISLVLIAVPSSWLGGVLHRTTARGARP